MAMPRWPSSCRTLSVPLISPATAPLTLKVGCRCQLQGLARYQKLRLEFCYSKTPAATGFDVLRYKLSPSTWSASQQLSQPQGLWNITGPYTTLTLNRASRCGIFAPPNATGQLGMPLQAQVRTPALLLSPPSFCYGTEPPAPGPLVGFFQPGNYRSGVRGLANCSLAEEADTESFLDIDPYSGAAMGGILLQLARTKDAPPLLPPAVGLPMRASVRLQLSTLVESRWPLIEPDVRATVLPIFHVHVYKETSDSQARQFRRGVLGTLDLAAKISLTFPIVSLGLFFGGILVAAFYEPGNQRGDGAAGYDCESVRSGGPVSTACWEMGLGAARARSNYCAAGEVVLPTAMNARDAPQGVPVSSSGSGADASAAGRSLYAPTTRVYIAHSESRHELAHQPPVSALHARGPTTAAAPLPPLARTLMPHPNHLQTRMRHQMACTSSHRPRGPWRRRSCLRGRRWMAPPLLRPRASGVPSRATSHAGGSRRFRGFWWEPAAAAAASPAAGQTGPCCPPLDRCPTRWAYPTQVRRRPVYVYLLGRTHPLSQGNRRLTLDRRVPFFCHHPLVNAGCRLPCRSQHGARGPVGRCCSPTGFTRSGRTARGAGGWAPAD